MNTLQRLACGLAVCVAVAGPVEALAQKKGGGAKASASAKKKNGSDDATARAKAHFDRGTRLYKQARYRDAIAAFEAAYKEKPHGVLFFNIAQSYEKLGDIPQALRAYHEYLRQLPDAEDRSTVEVAMRNLEKRLVEKGLQQLLVYSQPAGAQVVIDGKPAGTTPLARELPLGKHRVAVEIQGYALTERQVDLTANTSVVLDFTLEKVTETPPIATNGAGDGAKQPKDTPTETRTIVATPDPASAAPSQPLTASTHTTAGPEKKGRLWTWVAGGVGVAALATAAAFGMQAQAASDELRERGPGTPRSRAENDALVNRAHGNASTANVFYGVAGAAGIATVALFFVEGSF